MHGTRMTRSGGRAPAPGPAALQPSAAKRTANVEVVGAAVPTLPRARQIPLPKVRKKCEDCRDKYPGRPPFPVQPRSGSLVLPATPCIAGSMRCDAESQVTILREVRDIAAAAVVPRLRATCGRWRSGRNSAVVQELLGGTRGGHAQGASLRGPLRGLNARGLGRDPRPRADLQRSPKMYM